MDQKKDCDSQSLDFDPRAKFAPRKSPQEKRLFIDQLINAIPVPAFFKDIQGTYRSSNKACEILFGLKKQELLGKTAHDLLSGDQATLSEEVDRFLIGGDTLPRHCETFVLRPDGSRRAVIINKTTLNQGETIEGIVGTIHDITGKIEVQEELRQSEELLKRIFEAIPDLLSVVDADRRIVVSNWHGGFDYVPERVRQQKPFCFDAYYPEQGKPCEECHLLNVFVSGKPTVVEKFNPHVGHTEIHAFPIFDDQGRVVLAAEHIRNISQRKEAEEKLVHSEKQLRHITDNMLDLVSQANSEGIFQYVSPSHQTVLGYRSEDLLGRSLYDFMHPEDLARMRTLFQDMLPITGSVRAEFRYRHARDDYIWLETIGKRLLGCGKQGAGLVFASRDISERKQVEKTLQTVNQTLQATIQAAPLAILVLDPPGRIQQWNPAAERMFGWQAEEVMGCSYPLVPKSSQEEFISNLARMNRGESFVNQETVRQKKDQSLIDVSFSTAPLRDPCGNIAGTVGIIADITERRRSERELRESEANYRAIFDAANDAIFVLDIDSGAILDVNRKLCEMYGYSRKELCRMSIEALSSGQAPYTQENALTWIRSAVDDSSRLFEWQARKNGAEVFWVEVNMKGAMIGGCYRALAVVRDITERKQAEAELRESEERFRQIFEQNEDPAFLIIPQTLAIIDANSAAIDLYHRSKQEFIRHGLEILIEPDDLSEFTDKLALLADREPSQSIVSQISPLNTIDRHGATIIAAFRGKTIISRGSRYLYCTFRDITEKLRIRQERRDLEAKLLQTNKMTAIGTLASGIAHEINNPNNYILNNAQFLTEAWHDISKVLEDYVQEYGDIAVGGLPYEEAIEDIPELLSGLVQGSTRIRNIVGTLKDYARHDTEQMSQTVNINQAIEAAQMIIRSKVRKHTDHFYCTLAEQIPPVQGNFQKLEQVIINLVINALQALPKRTLGVYLSTDYDKASKNIVVKIRDQGVGMPKEIRERILEPFFTTKQEQGGTGLGLSICYSIVKEHKGTLEFESEPGQGTTALLKLPTF